MPIPCCLCGIPIEPCATNMCTQCLRTQVDVCEGINKEACLFQCRKCSRYRRGNGWVDCGLESLELMAICLKTIEGLGKVKLIDAKFIWTEPHSKRIKVKLVVQKETLNNAIVQQQCIVTFVVRNEQCKDCTKQFTNSTWKSLVQVRQKVDHKRTFFYLEQVILKHKGHSKATNMEGVRDGMDFYFSEKNHAEAFCHFLSSYVPQRTKSSSQLVSSDNHNNTANIKWTFLVEIAPICKDDVLVLPSRVAQQCSNMPNVTVISKITSQIHLIDPFTGQRGTLSAEKYWRDSSLSPLLSAPNLIEFIVLDVEPLDHKPSKAGVSSTSFRERDCVCQLEVARSSDFGVNDTTFFVQSYMGNILHSGDTVLGYDLTTCNFTDSSLYNMNNRELPDIILVRRHYSHKKSTTLPKLKSLGIAMTDSKRKVDIDRMDRDYESFLEELCEDTEMKLQLLVEDQVVQVTPDIAVVQTDN